MVYFFLKKKFDSEDSPHAGADQLVHKSLTTIIKTVLPSSSLSQISSESE
jgi:hypothetical protein